MRSAENSTELLAAGFTDTFRYRNPDAGRRLFSWWSYRFHARENNAGWRIDYFLISDRLARPAIEAAPIYHEIFGSDHCPVGLEPEGGTLMKNRKSARCCCWRSVRCAVLVRVHRQRFGRVLYELQRLVQAQLQRNATS